MPAVLKNQKECFSNTHPLCTASTSNTTNKLKKMLELFSLSNAYKLFCDVYLPDRLLLIFSPVWNAAIKLSPIVFSIEVYLLFFI